MGAASFVQGDFRGGEWSQTAQGNIADPKYKTSMNVCLNGIPMEPGAWTRRPGTRFCGTTRGGLPGRVIAFDFHDNQPYTMEATDSHLRFFNGASIVTTNDDVAVTSISTASPALLTVASAVTWATADRIFLNNVTSATPLLLDRLFVLTKVSTTTFTLTDAVTGSNIDGSTLGTLAGGVTVSRVLDLVTPFTSGTWSAIRSVQSEQQALLLSGAFPQVLTVTPKTVGQQFATFALTPGSFLDGPYLDPFTNGVLITPASLTGLVTMTLGFAAYSASIAYPVGAYVTSSSVNYISLIDQNLNNTPASVPTAWAVTSAGTAIGQNGFTGADVGRHIRLLSEPLPWAVGTSYASGAAVSYLDSNGNKTYYTWTTSTTTATTANAPSLGGGWGVNAAAAIWTWGKITALSNLISGTLSGSTNIGDMTGEAGLSAAFNGITNQIGSSCAAGSNSGTATGTSITRYVGKNYSGASAQAISVATVFPSNNLGFIVLSPIGGSSAALDFKINLRAKASAPANSSDGTLLGSTSIANGTPLTSPVTILSNDTATTWNYVWVEIVFTVTISGGGTFRTETLASQVQFFSAAGTGTSTGATVQILGPALLYTSIISTWRLGLFSGTTGYPSCGTYHEGRLWLSGVVGNRIDGSMPVTVSPQGTIANYSFAPTASDGTVTDSSGISYTFDAPDVSTIYWMQPDQQGILCGTQAGEWLVQASSLNSPLTPTSMQAHRVTKIGCANIEPRRAEHTLVITQRHQRKLVEYFSDVFSGKFTAPNLAEKAKHLTAASIEEIVYQQELVPTVWARLGDNSLVGMTYKRDTLMTSQGPTINGWHRHTLGSGRVIESICVSRNDSGSLDTLMMVTNDVATGVRHVELMTDLFEEGSALTTAWFLDDAIVPANYTTSIVMGGASGITINGLWHLNGKTVTIFAGGLDAGDWPVTNGSALVPFAPSTTQTNALFTAAFVAAFSGAMPILAGFTYNSDGQLSRPDTIPESGARNGPGFGKLRRMHKFAAKLVDTQGISFGTRFTNNGLHAAQLKTPGGTALLAANVLFNGIHKDTMNDDAQGFASQLCWRISRPFPATVAAMGGFLETVDE